MQVVRRRYPCIVGLALALTMLASACHTFCPPGIFHDDADCPCALDAKVCKTPTVRALAHDLDALEGQIDGFGSAVPQQPSVWGQARMTSHREEFEKVMAGQLNNFYISLQASLSRSDQAYLADALALSVTAAAAAGGGSPAATTTPNSSSSSSSSASASGSGSATANSSGTGSNPSGSGGESNVFTTPTGTFDAFSKLTRNDARLPNALGFATAGGKGGVQLEPTVVLDQMKRYLDHLHALRHINEGDDTADSPGYALNLVRNSSVGAARIQDRSRLWRGNYHDAQAVSAPRTVTDDLPQLGGKRFARSDWRTADGLFE